MSYRKEIDLGKVDYNGTGRKANRVTLDVRIEDRRGEPELSIMGNVWNHLGTDIYSGGQNLDTIARLFPNDPKVQRILEVWREWHLNCMHAGTPAQEQAIKEGRESGEITTYPDWYGSACRYLESRGLLEDNGYRYGSAWLSRELPQGIIAEVESW